jgi:four helix bundle protein
MGTGFQDLVVWGRAKELALAVYRLTRSEPLSRDFALRDQMWRSAISIPSNIAEGDERETDKEAVRFLYIAKGSAAELLTQLIIAHEIGCLDSREFTKMESMCFEVSRMLSKLIAARSLTTAKR